MINFSKKFYLTAKNTKWVLVDFDGTIHPYDKKDKNHNIKNPPNLHVWTFVSSIVNLENY